MQHKSKLTKGPMKGKTVVFNDTMPEVPTDKEIKNEDIYNRICEVSYYILDKIIAPVIGNEPGDIIADCNLACINDYTMGDKKENKKILDKLFKYAKVKKDSYVWSVINEDMALNLVSIILLGEATNS